MLLFLAGLGLPSGLLHSGIPTKTLYTFIVSPVSAKCSAHLILPDLITLTTFGDQYKSRSTSQRSLLQPPVTASHFPHSTFPFAYVVPKHPLNSEAL